MPKKSTKQEEPKFDPPVIPEAAIDIDAFMRKEPGTVPSPVTPVLVAYAPFELDGVEYAEGDTFTPPAGWVHAADFDQFRGIQQKNKMDKEIGIAFSVPGEWIDRKNNERAYHTRILPLKEA